VRRRFNLIPFTVTIPKEERDPDLPLKLEAEWPGILAWAIQGCLEWQRIGLSPPPAVLAATSEYLDDEDAIGRFIKENCEIGDPQCMAEVTGLFQAWSVWCSANKEWAGSAKRFSQNLAGRGFLRVLHPENRRACVMGIRVKVLEGLMGLPGMPTA
jgi:putative DNA primase/helicase